MKRAQSCIWTLLPAILFLFLTFGHVQAIGVQPLVFELDLKPGDIAPLRLLPGQMIPRKSWTLPYSASRRNGMAASLSGRKR